MEQIFTIVKSNSYGDFGDQYNISYHRTEEGAYLEMDRLVKEDRDFSDMKMVETSYNSLYYYSTESGYSTLSVESLNLME